MDVELGDCLMLQCYDEEKKTEKNLLGFAWKAHVQHCVFSVKLDLLDTTP